MALMFQRLARNFVKNGYFPTDEETTSRILSALAPAEQGHFRILDPCCGEGVALAECTHRLGAECTEAFGIEYDAERAWHAKGLLDRGIHGDFIDCIVGRRQFGLLWLNPPYGDLVADRSRTAPDYPGKGRKRLEKLFYARANGLLQPGGVMVLIVPDYSLDSELAGWIASQFAAVRAFRAPEQQFKQVVIFGVRRRSGDLAGAAETRKRLASISDEEAIDELPAEWPFAPYVVPAAPPGPATFVYSRLEPRQLGLELARGPSLWDQFELRFGKVVRPHRRPLRRLSDWHLALALAAGQVSGVIRARDGRVYAIKGDTHKEKELKVEHETKANGAVTEIRIHTDRFVPVIRALDFTPGSPSFGRALVIR